MRCYDCVIDTACSSIEEDGVTLFFCKTCLRKNIKERKHQNTGYY
jgi:hypothetical protein